MGNSDEVEIPYDKYLGSTENGWKILIDTKVLFVPSSIGDIDEISRVAYIPQWLAEKEGLEDYISE